MGEYTQGFRAAMVRRMTGPAAVSANALHAESGVAQSTLSRWLRQAGSLDEVSKRSSQRFRRANRWSPAEKLRIIVAAAGLDDEALGALLRKEGVHQAQLAQWRVTAEQALDVSVAAKAEAAHAQELATLRKELARKDKALAEAAARLVLRKKLEALWGDEDDDTTPPSGPRSSPRSSKP